MEERSLSEAKFTPVWKDGRSMEGYHESHSAEWDALRYQSFLPKGLRNIFFAPRLASPLGEITFVFMILLRKNNPMIPGFVYVQG